jgi:RNA polymerase sigma-70 factor (ECF subfamily)
MRPVEARSFVVGGNARPESLTIHFEIPAPTQSNSGVEPKAFRMPPGETTPLDRLVEEHLPGALRFAIRLTGNPESAEEVVQEALLRVARSWRTFRQQAQFRTWLFRIVINVFRDRTPTRLAPTSLATDVVDGRVADPAARLLSAELSQLVAARVSALPPRQREVLVLVAYEGHSPREAAELLGISEASVYSNLSVARQRLREELAPYVVGQRDD